MAAFDRVAGPIAISRSLMRIGAFAILCVCRAAEAAMIGVDSTADDTSSNGNCTLREAVIAANTDGAADDCPAGCGADVIVVPAGTYVLTLAGTGEDGAATGDLDVTADVEIQGAGVASTIIDGNASDRVLDFDPGAAGITARLSGVTVRNGRQVIEGGGIRNAGTLTVADSTVVSNVAESGSATPAKGGGVRNSGSLTVTNSTIVDNFASASSLMSFTTAEGAGISNSGTAVITTSTIDGNTAFCSGVFAYGGGVASTGTLTIDASTVSNNDGITFIDGDETLGGGVYSTGTLTLTNSTISGNTVTDMGAPIPSHHGGGLFLAGNATINNCTVTDNSAFFGSGIVSAGTVTFRNTIVANNAGADCDSDLYMGTHVADAYNLDSDDTCGFSGTDLTTVDPLLGALQDNGGPTLTHSLLPGSPALEAGNPAIPGSGGNACAATDQRGAARPQRVRCDIGSVEVEPCPAEPLNGCATPGKALLLIKDRDADGAGAKDKLIWKWLKGPAAAQSAFGDPTTTASYWMCLYTGTAEALAVEAFMAANGTCGTAPCWQAIGDKGYKRFDPATTSGIAKVILKGGAASSKIIVKGRDANLDLSPATLPLDAGADVLVQLGNSQNTNCWQSAFPPGAVDRNEETAFKARAP